MSKRSKRKREVPFFTPFEKLEALAKAKQIPKAAEVAPPVSAPVAEKTESEPGGDTDEASFARAMRDVRRLAEDARAPYRAPTRPPPPADDNAAVVAELDALVGGQGAFDLRWSDEHVEGLAKGIDRRLLRKLRQGGFSFRAHLDLHGLTRKEAKPQVVAFLERCRRDGERCVLIVHGRGLNSADRIPVLKEALAGWLTRGAVGKAVMAFCSARPADGGLGAVYVLLRRR